VNPYGRMHINRMLVKLPKNLCHERLLGTIFHPNSKRVLAMDSLLMQWINKMIQNGSALQYGLRKFEIFRFDKENFDVIEESLYLEKIGQESRKLILADLADSCEDRNDYAVLERIEQLIKDH
jgi:hypothetical protein